MSNNTPVNSVQKTLQNIRIVMIQTSHTGNMGAAARAMKVMGLTDLYLVKPKNVPDDQAVAMSSNAHDILENATIVENLNDAIKDCQLVVGTSARYERTLSWDIQDSRSCAELIATQIHTHNDTNVAILFGRESSGLTNQELALCQHLVHIPTNPDYSSLNIASAVQILAYECRLAALNIATNTEHSQKQVSRHKNNDLDDELVNADDLEAYFEHLKQVLIEINFIDPENPRYLLPRLRRLYSRSGLRRSEMNILRGILAAFQRQQK